MSLDKKEGYVREVIVISQETIARPWMQLKVVI